MRCPGSYEDRCLSDGERPHAVPEEDLSNAESPLRRPSELLEHLLRGSPVRLVLQGHDLALPAAVRPYPPQEEYDAALTLARELPVRSGDR